MEKVLSHCVGLRIFLENNFIGSHLTRDLRCEVKSAFKCAESMAFVILVICSAGVGASGVHMGTT